MHISSTFFAWGGSVWCGLARPIFVMSSHTRKERLMTNLEIIKEVEWLNKVALIDCLSGGVVDVADKLDNIRKLIAKELVMPEPEAPEQERKGL